MINYFLKYKKYKNKCFNIKNQIGGNLFELVFENVIKYCIEYNKTENERETLFGDDNRFVHIKGGASIKYHLIKNGAPLEYHQNITSDIDLFLVCEADDVIVNLTTFVDGLKLKFPEYSINLKNNNGLYVITFNEIDIIDITIFNEHYVEPDSDTSMFLYAINNLGYVDHEKYFKELEKISYDDILENYSLLETKTFTSLKLEKYAAIKGSRIYETYLKNIPKWIEQRDNYLRMSQNMQLVSSQRQQYLQFAERYAYQTSSSYIDKLNDKLTRYNRKIVLISTMITD